ncbi:aldo/keto reductase [Phanerochaete sordida]|uniref:Aldo/keto reductase n=1 Tax=Phanerochaete sordida TaxID=48140 RepID=A0A9P3GQ58_9APHY|nr:aldo/keto reductase [Phanerochaete sordida]
MTAIPSFTLNNGITMPGLGSGCWLGADGGTDVAEEICRNALQCGYRHIDTAAGYYNEEQVGRAVRACGVPRAEIFVTTKLRQRDGHRVREAFEDSLKALDIGYIDLYLMHWPMTHLPDGSRARSFDEHPNFVDVWAEMEKLLDTGKVRAIGVSNFSIPNLEILLAHARVVPANNQIEVHPYLPQHALRAFCAARGILVSAYSPFGQGNPLFFSDPALAAVAAKHGASPARAVLSWVVARGVPPLVKSARVERMRENLALVELDEADLAAIDAIHAQPGCHRSLLKYHQPDGTVFGWTYEQLGWAMRAGGYVQE